MALELSRIKSNELKIGPSIMQCSRMEGAGAYEERVLNIAVQERFLNAPMFSLSERCSEYGNYGRKPIR